MMTNPSSEQKFKLDYKDALGIGLIAVGVCIGLWIFTTVIKTFQNPHHIDGFRDLITSNLKTLVSAGEKDLNQWRFL